MNKEIAIKALERFEATPVMRGRLLIQVQTIATLSILSDVELNVKKGSALFLRVQNTARRLHKKNARLHLKEFSGLPTHHFEYVIRNEAVSILRDFRAGGDKVAKNSVRHYQIRKAVAERIKQGAGTPAWLKPRSVHGLVFANL